MACKGIEGLCLGLDQHKGSNSLLRAELAKIPALPLTSSGLLSWFHRNPALQTESQIKQAFPLLEIFEEEEEADSPKRKPGTLSVTKSAGFDWISRTH